jgi:hypothetical protein
VQTFFKRRLKVLSLLSPFDVSGMSQRQHASRLVDDDQMLIQMQDSNIIVFGRRRQGLMSQFDHVSRNNSPPLIDAQNPIDGDSAAFHMLPCRRPRQILHIFSQGPQNGARSFCGDCELLSGHLTQTQNYFRRVENRALWPGEKNSEDSCAFMKLDSV